MYVSCIQQYYGSSWQIHFVFSVFKVGLASEFAAANEALELDVKSDEVSCRITDHLCGKLDNLLFRLLRWNSEDPAAARGPFSRVSHDDVIKWKAFSALLALGTGNSPVTGEFPAQGQWRGALMFSLICAWINDWVKNREAGDLRRHRAHYDVTVMAKLRGSNGEFMGLLCCNVDWTNTFLTCGIKS